LFSRAPIAPSLAAAAVALTTFAGCSTPKRLDLDRSPERGGATSAPVLAAMRAELDRSVTELQARGDPAPYFVAYEVVDRHAVDIEAEFGALLASDDTQSREFDVDVRVGSPKLDNTHAIRGRDTRGGMSRRFGGAHRLPIEDDTAALRAALWLATDERYKDAAERLIKVKSEHAIDAPDDDLSEDFTADALASFVGAPANLDVNRAEWEARVRSLSAIFRLRPEVLEAKVQFVGSAETHYFASSEGATLQRGTPHARLVFTVQAKSDDGMDLQLTDTVDASLASKLPDDATLLARAKSLVEQLVALRAAPPAEPYVGPAILDGRAASVFFHETFGHRIEGQRQKSEQEGQTFAKKVGERVMPEFIDVWDDPTVRSLNGVELNGWYPFDDEGVASKKATLVDKGVLRGFLMSRTPTRGFTHSNGHGRRAPGQDVVARQANLVVDPVRVRPAADLKKMLLAEVKKQGKPYGLRFAEVEGGYTTTARADIQAFKVRPVIVYRVLPDGREELVRGVDLEGTPLTALSTILAAGNDFAVFNGYCGAESGWVPVSAASPSLLVGQMEVARKPKGHDRPPILPPPALSPGGPTVVGQK
jgi:predicted Zn-dependent protease